MGQKQKCEKEKMKKRPQKRTVTYGSYHRAVLPSVSTAAARWHPKATAQDGSNPWKRIHGIVMGLQIPWGQRFNQKEGKK